MADETSETAPQNDTHTISADFLTGDAEQGLERIRTRLLDLTNRNRLLKFRHSKSSSIRVVDAHLDAIFQRLIDGARIPFLPVPEPGILITDTVSPEEQAKELGWDTSFDLEECADPKTECLPVLHYQDSLDTITRKIGSAAKTAIEESGTNMLHLVFGFLEWYESDDSSQSRLAPLIAVPVSIERAGSRGHRLENVIEFSGEDIDSNLSLIEKMRRDFGIELPHLEDDDSPETYFRRFAGILALKPTWKIRRQITLAMLSFGKLLMYRDLDPKNWPNGQNIERHSIVRELFEGTKCTEIAFAEEYPIDAIELKQDVPQLIMDADSSQHSALIHALRGGNVVIEGPPGTGKSQTISNLIAAALARGKTVLFVSEKLAALEVVRSRLDDAGLGSFCLELHSHKTKKGALLNDIAERFKLRGGFRDPQVLDHHTAEVEQKKQLLTKYCSLINKKVEPFGSSVFEVLWARERLSQQTSRYREEIAQLLLPSLASYTQPQFVEAEQFLALYSQHLSNTLSAWSSTEKHPWSWLSRSLDFNDEEKLLEALESLVSLVQRANQSCDVLEHSAGIILERSQKGLLSAAETLAVLPRRGANVWVPCLDKCKSAVDRRELFGFVGSIVAYEQAQTELRSFTSDPIRFDQVGAVGDLQRALQQLSEWRLERQTLADLTPILKVAEDADRLAEEALPSNADLVSALGVVSEPCVVSAATFTLDTIRLIEQAPLEKLYLRRLDFEDESTQRVLSSGKEKARLLKKAQEELGQNFDLSLKGGQFDLLDLSKAATVIQDSSIWKRLFGSEYRKAVKLHKAIKLRNVKVSRDVRSDELRALAGFLRERGEFERSDVYRQLLSTHFQGIDSPWEDALGLAEWYQQVLLVFPAHQLQSAPFRALLFSGKTELIRAIHSKIPNLEEQLQTTKEYLDILAEIGRRLPTRRASFSGLLDEAAEQIRRLVSDLRDALKCGETFAMLPAFSFGDLPSLSTAVKEYQDSKSTALLLANVPRLIGSYYNGLETDVESLAATLQFAESLASDKLPPAVAAWVLCEDCDERLKRVNEGLGKAVDFGAQIHIVMEELARLSGSTFWSNCEEKQIAILSSAAEFSLQNSAELAQWIHLLRLQSEARKMSLDRLTLKGDQKAIEAKDLPIAFRFVFYNTLSRSAFSENPHLGQTSGITQETLRKQFAASDKESIRLYRERVAATIDRRPLPFGNQAGPVKGWTEMALVQNEMNKQMRHIPIRQLLLRSGNALQALKPCFMMGPLSVAQYLAPGQLKFDLVVMDEASQLKPEDAIGAIARGGQVVIVGDPKQLPPTNFFQRVAIDDEEDDENRMAVEDGESILDVASTLFQPVRRLRWHYRSRHHSLIAFSNQEFYQRDLIIFPSAYHDHASLGVKHQFVRDGVFENGRNPREAAVVVEAVLEHMRENPDESVGVVTLNFEQKELLEELLDKKLREDPAAIAFQEKMTGGQHSLFLKNLENVQGDERDVIFISTTYGLDARGNQFQRFGPITGPNGHRRLNVLFTRAKKRVVVFSSLDPERIHTTATSPWGVRALKQYLIYARSGILEQPNEDTAQPTNHFEESVGAILKEKGFNVVPQVGVAGFFIDLAIKHPAKEGAFLLGIECDGATYHSARSARDRDRLRQEILESLGWRIHRIWSTDWFKSRDREISRLLQKIQDLLDKDPEYQRQQQVLQKKASLRESLLEFRESDIAVAFPNTPIDKCLLGPELLDELCLRRPKTRDDWFRRIPQELRTKVESQQVARFLDPILRLIAEVG